APISTGVLPLSRGALLDMTWGRSPFIADIAGIAKAKPVSRELTRMVVNRGRLHSRKLHPCQLSSEAGFAHVLEHLSHLGVLAEELVDFLDSGARSAGDAFAAAAVDDLVMLALVLRHGVDDGFHARELRIVDVVGSLLHVGERPDRGQH